MSGSEEEVSLGETAFVDDAQEVIDPSIQGAQGDGLAPVINESETQEWDPEEADDNEESNINDINDVSNGLDEDEEKAEGENSGAVNENDLLDEAEFAEQERQEEQQELEDDVYGLQTHKVEGDNKSVTKKKNVRKTNRFTGEGSQEREQGYAPSQMDSNDNDNNNNSIVDEDPQMRRRRLLEEKMDSAIKTKTVRRRRADEDDLERMQDDKIDHLKDLMIKAANLDVEKNSQGQIATEKLKLLNEVIDVMAKADSAIPILDNNLLEAVRLWLEPLPDASMPAYQIQKELINALTTLPIKTDHLVASGIGKVLVYYQRSKRTEPNLKKIVNRLIGDWTRPILNKSDSYKDRNIQFHEYSKHKFVNQLASSRRNKPKEAKSLYEQSAERRKRAAIPSARTTAYKIAPKVDASLLRRQQIRSNVMNDERFRRLNQKLTLMNTKKSSKKAGPSIEGRNLAL